MNYQKGAAKTLKKIVVTHCNSFYKFLILAHVWKIHEYSKIYFTLEGPH